MGQPRPTQLIGHTNFYDSGRDEKLHNSMTVELEQDRCVLKVGPASDVRRGETVETTSPTVLRHHRTVLAAMRRQSRRRELHPVAKPGDGTGRKHVEVVVCPDCGNTRWIEDADGGWQECPRCGGGVSW